ncbi:MAG: helix-turn-helix transcriptional regulator [Planctomycetes bacterium]|nr:helix-turn-helix transcriptional regulator [Planctomycetota bacterium]
MRVLGWPALPTGGVLRSQDGEVLDLSEVSNDFEALSRAFALSKREREVACWVQQGLSNKEIASELGISPQTVKRHLSNLLKKSKVESRTELAYRLGGAR